MDDNSRRYDDREVKALLSRAAELASETRVAERPREGMSLAELERAALEAGLPVEALRRAAAELESGGIASGKAPGIVRRLFGAMSDRIERLLPGRLDDAALSRLALEFPDLAGVPGNATTAGGDLVFRSDGGYESTYGQRVRFEIKGEGDSTRVVAERKFGSAAAGVYGGLGGGLGLGIGFGVGGGVGLGALHSGSAFALIAMGSLCAAWLISRGVMALIRADAARRNARLVEDLASRIESRRRDDAAAGDAGAVAAETRGLSSAR